MDSEYDGEDGTMSVADESDNNNGSGGETIRVTVRFRPLLPREKKGSIAWQVQASSNSVTAVQGHGGRKAPYVFDEVYDANYSTETIYRGIARSIALSALDGVHGSIFAYGQTSSGKTFTMQGYPAQSSNNARESDEDGEPADTPPQSTGETGIIQLALKDMFAHMAERSDNDFLVRVSYIEIYNETVRDLLDPTSGVLSVREHPLHGVFCDCSERIVSDEGAIMRALRDGERNRSVGATNMNEKSSRSHSIFRVVVESRSRSRVSDCNDDVESSDGSTDGSEVGVDCVRVGCLNFVDLAGSESSRHTGATGKRQAEAGNINRSLLALSRVVAALSSRKDNSLSHVNFRDSKLTRILQPSLNGSARVLFICCASPCAQFMEDTRSTLNFATRAKRIKVNAGVNEIVGDNSRALKKLQGENAALKRELERMKRLEETNAQLRKEIERLQEDHASSTTLKDADPTYSRPATVLRRRKKSGRIMSASMSSTCSTHSDSCGSERDTIASLSDEEVRPSSSVSTASITSDPSTAQSMTSQSTTSQSAVAAACKECELVGEELDIWRNRHAHSQERIKHLEQELARLESLAFRRQRRLSSASVSSNSDPPCKLVPVPVASDPVSPTARSHHGVLVAFTLCLVLLLGVFGVVRVLLRAL